MLTDIEDYGIASFSFFWYTTYGKEFIARI
jgi:hypothetical protein